MLDRIAITDEKHDILSHTGRGKRIHVLTLDHALADDVCERINNDPRMKFYKLIRPRETRVRQAVEKIEAMAPETVHSRLLIIDVRKFTLTKLQWAYNKIVGYNRRDLNKLCYILLIGDGPSDLFRQGKSVDVFVLHLARHRVDFHPAAFFFDPHMSTLVEPLPSCVGDDRPASFEPIVFGAFVRGQLESTYDHHAR